MNKDEVRMPIDEVISDVSSKLAAVGFVSMPVVELIINATLNSISENLLNDKVVELPGVCALKLKTRNYRDPNGKGRGVTPKLEARIDYKLRCKSKELHPELYFK